VGVGGKDYSLKERRK